MKRYISMILGVLVVASCATIDYPDRFVQTEGLPKVDFIRYADKDVVITQANMEEVVCIVGENLTSIHDLYFNGQHPPGLGAQEHAGRRDQQDLHVHQGRPGSDL